MNVVRAKADVQFATIAPAGFRILAALDALARTLRKDILLTCGTEAHTNPDPHATGEAYDVGLVGWTPADITTALATLRATAAGELAAIQKKPKAKQAKEKARAEAAKKK